MESDIKIINLIESLVQIETSKEHTEMINAKVDNVSSSKL